MRKPLEPLSSVDLAALVQLCNLKKVIQRNDGYGRGSETVISRASAAMLKRRNFAVTGWSHEMYPTKSGCEFVAAYARISHLAELPCSASTIRAAPDFPSPPSLARVEKNVGPP